MRIIGLTPDTVEILWIDDREVEYIPVPEFISRYGREPIDNYLKQ